MLLALFACVTPESDDSAISPCFSEDGGFAGEDVATLQSECESGGGSACDAGGWIGVDAATCLAAESGLTLEMSSAFDTDLVFHADWLTVVWNVTNVEYIETSEQGGSGRTIHATTGAILEETGWSSME